MIEKIHHVGIAVHDLDESLKFYRDTLNLHVHAQEEIKDQGVRAALLTIGQSEIELLEPLNADSPIAKFIDRKGEGLHHICFRARARADVDEIHRFLREIGASIVHAPEEGSWAPGYYSVLFEDPDGIRLEMNFVPGKGLLEEPKT